MPIKVCRVGLTRAPGRGEKGRESISAPLVLVVVLESLLPTCSLFDDEDDDDHDDE